MRLSRFAALVMILLIGLASQAQQTELTVGTLRGDHSGYTLITPLRSHFVYLIDPYGRAVNEWRVSGQGRDAFLRENGNLVVSVPKLNPDESFAANIQFAQRDGRIEEYTWDGERIWAYEFERPDFRVHHGINLMPDGNVQFIAWERKTREEAIANGRNPAILGDGLWTDAIFEVDPTTSEIVWEWHVWDHLVQDFDPTKANYGVVADNPQRIDINFFEGYELIEDWIHANSIGYNPQLGHLAISAREQNEIWVIDRNITTEEAAGPAGDLLYRWGNAAAYDRGTDETHQLFYQHDIQWIPEGLPGAGNMIAFSNTHPMAGGDFFSRIVEWTPPLQEDDSYAIDDGEPYGPLQPAWTWQTDPPQDFFSQYISGMQRLRNGNTLITYGGEGILWEVTPAGDIVWEYQLPFNGVELIAQGGEPDARIFRARRYEDDHPALAGRDLQPIAALQDMAGRQG